MSSQPHEPAPAKPPEAHGNDRELRADARRNRERVLRTAQQLFATEGLGVSLDEIARRAGVGPGTVHRHFPAKEALYLAVATDMLEQLVAEADVLATTDDPAALFTLLARMMAAGAGNVAVKSALEAAVARRDATAGEVMALVAGAFAAIRHAGAETSRERSAHLAQIILDGLRPPPR